MCLQNIYFYRRLIYRQYIKVNNVIRPYSHIPDDNKNKSSEIIKSLKFPDYQLVYAFPHIAFPCLLNVMKRNQTIVAGLSVPVLIGLQVTGLIPGDECIKLICVCFIITAWFHVVCHACNNLIGSVYLKDNQEVIISYVDYWGKRRDLKTNVNDIIPPTERTTSLMKYSLYKKLGIQSCKQQLKINVPYGRIIDETRFKNIFGDNV
nr:transmembrane protein 186 isoform X1 [Osmia lignaria]